jgi:hypothetical protein
MVKLVNLKDFQKKFKGKDLKTQICSLVVKEWFVEFLMNLEEVESIEKDGAFYLIENPEDFSDDNMNKIGLSEGILQVMFEETSRYVIKVGTEEIELFNTLILYNNEYGVNIFFTKENCHEKVFDYLTKDLDLSDDRACFEYAIKTELSTVF